MKRIIYNILNKLNNNGYESYIIGGYVRDLLLGKKSFDIDIITNALPDTICNLFNQTKISYGSVNFKIDKYNIDITTFRKDSNYINRHPKVEYIDSLEEDLKRRDFTINTICMDKDGNIIDLLNGINDLNNKIIRCIGNIDDKLTEDPLRILRAIRLATTLNFKIDGNLYNGLIKYNTLVKKLPNTRIKQELDKILMSKNYLYGLNLLESVGIKDILNMEYSNVIYSNNLDTMYSEIKIDNIPFTKKEKSNIINIREIINIKDINYLVIYKYGLSLSIEASKVLGISIFKVLYLYITLPIRKRKDIKVSKEYYKYLNELEYLILTKKIKNNSKTINNYLEGKYKNV